MCAGRHAARAAGHDSHLAIFLSGDGSDIRIEDRSAARDGSSYRLHVPETAKLSTTHNGTGAMIVPATGQPWQVLVRGGAIQVEHGAFAITAGPDDGQPLNFALKRVAKAERAAPPRAAAEKPATRQTQKTLRGRERPPGNPRLL